MIDNRPIKCSVCDKAENEMFACDETGEWYCLEHFEPIQCEEKHGEGCRTLVFQGSDE
jgi:hypothetical protein